MNQVQAERDGKLSMIIMRNKILAACIAAVLSATLLLTGCPSSIPEMPPSYLLQWGDYGTGDGQFSQPFGIAVDAAGNVYVSDSHNHRIQKFTSTGVYLTQWGSFGTGNGQFRYPAEVTVDAAGNVYVVDDHNHRIQKFDSSGGFITKWGTYGIGNVQFQYPTGVDADASGNIYVAENLQRRVQKFDNNGGFIAKWGSNGTADGQFSQPFGIAVDAAGNVFVIDVQSHRIQKFSGSGVFISKWGTYGAGAGQFNQPGGITVDAAGNVYVGDVSNHRIQKFSNSGGYLTQWGINGAANGQFYGPHGVAVDATGNIYVVDTYNHRIQKFGKSTSPVKVPVGVGEATLIPNDKKPAPLLPGNVIVNATLNGSPMILNTGTVTFTLTGPQQTYTGYATQVYPNMPVGNYNIGSIIGGPPGSTLFNITSSPVQALATGDTITFTLNFRSNPVAAGTVIVNATLDGSPWTGTVNYALTGPSPVSGASVPQTSNNMPVGAYALAYTSGGPAGATLLSTTPSVTQSLTTGNTITYTFNFRTNKVDTGTLNIGAMLDGVAWTGPLNFNVAGPLAFSGTSVTAPYSNVPVGSYTVAYASGGPPNATFVNITSSSTQTLAAGGAITFTLNFRSKPVETGTINVNATWRQAAGISPWTGTLSFTLTGTGLPAISGNSVNQTYTGVPIGSYTLTYVSGGPSGTALFSTTPSSIQTLGAGGAITFTMEFR